MSNEIAEIPPAETALEVYQKPRGLDPWLEKIKAEVTGHVPDLTTRKGREHIASLAFKVRKSKTALDGLGKKLVDDLKDVPKRIDAERKRMRDALDALADEVRKPLTEWEDAEEARIAKHKAGIQHIKDCAVGLIGGEPQPYAILFRELEEKVVIDTSWEEFEAEAHRAKAEALTRLKTMFEEQQKREAEQAELARLRAEAAAREQKEREKQIAREAAQRVQREAEAKAQAEREAAERRELELKLAAERAERARAEAIQTAEREKAEAKQREEQAKRDAAERQRQAIEAERKRVADEQARQAAEARRREADKAHKAKINRAALEAFVAGGMPEACAKTAVTLIARGAVPAVRINY